MTQKMLFYTDGASLLEFSFVRFGKGWGILGIIIQSSVA